MNAVRKLSLITLRTLVRLPQPWQRRCYGLGRPLSLGVIRRLLQSCFNFREDITPEVYRLVEVEGAILRQVPRRETLEESLDSMRRTIFANAFDAAFFVGGMSGINDEYKVLREMQPEVAIFLLESPGGMTAQIADQLAHKDNLGELLGSPFGRNTLLRGRAYSSLVLRALHLAGIGTNRESEEVPDLSSVGLHRELDRDRRGQVLFNALREEILLLDPQVSENVRKSYVAYRATTNFVEVVPLGNRLRLSLNIPLQELDDPEGMVLNVPSNGRWVNGEVQVSLSSLNELPYIVDLIRQSFARQMH